MHLFPSSASASNQSVIEENIVQQLVCMHFVSNRKNHIARISFISSLFRTHPFAPFVPFFPVPFIQVQLGLWLPVPKPTTW